jgi:hypothetical protein
MPTTTNYGWTTPADTDLVKDGAAAIRTLGSSVDSTLKTQIDNTVASSIQKTLTTTTGDIIYASGANTPARLGIGSSGQVLQVSGGVPAWVTQTSSAITWTSKVASPSGVTFNQVAHNGGSVYVAVGESGQLYSSTDSGSTWTSRTSGFGSNHIYDVFYGNSLWVAVGQNGTITTSSDGITWTARTSNMSTNTIYAVTYANSLWVAVGSGGGATNTGGLTYSSDGTTWTRKSQTLSVGTNYSCVVWNGTNWIIGADISTNNYLWATTPSGTWTAATVAGGNSVNGLWWDGTRHIIHNNQQFWYNTATTLASAISIQYVPQTSFGINNAKYFSGSMYMYNAWLQSFITASNIQPVLGTPSISPNAIQNSTYPNASGGALCVTSQGRVIADGRGRIYTSF